MKILVDPAGADVRLSDRYRFRVLAAAPGVRPSGQMFMAATLNVPGSGKPPVAFWLPCRVAEDLTPRFGIPSDPPLPETFAYLDLEGCMRADDWFADMMGRLLAEYRDRFMRSVP